MQRFVEQRRGSAVSRCAYLAVLLLDVRSECIDHALRLLHVLIPVPLLEAFVAVAENLLANLSLCMHAGATSDTARKDTRHHSEEELLGEAAQAREIMLKANQQARANLGQGVDGEAFAQVSLPKRGVDVVHQREEVLAQRACLALAVFECGLQAFLLVDFCKETRARVLLVGTSGVLFQPLYHLRPSVTG